MAFAKLVMVTHLFYLVDVVATTQQEPNYTILPSGCLDIVKG